MKQESLQRIDAFLESSLVELFASHGANVSPSANRDGGIDRPIAATIGFASDVLRGVLVLTVSQDLAAKTLPENLKATGVGDEIVADWTGELSNQMLGRLKNRFHAAGIDIRLSTPIVFVGKEMRHYSKDSPIQRSLYFAEGKILVEFHADYDNDFDIGVCGNEEAISPSGGDILFF